MRFIFLFGTTACAFMNKEDLGNNDSDSTEDTSNSDTGDTDTSDTDTGDTDTSDTDTSDTDTSDTDTSDTDTSDTDTGDTDTGDAPRPSCSLPNASITSASSLIQMNGVQEGDLFGWEVLACDVNNDGNADVIASAPYANALLGKVAVFYGPGNLWGGNMTLSTADTVIAEVDYTTSGLFGSRLGCGDIDGDGDDDLIVGRGEGRNGFNGTIDVGLFVYKNIGQSWSNQLNAGDADIILSYDSGVSSSASSPHFPMFWVSDVDNDNIDEVLFFMNSNSNYSPYAPNADNKVWQLDLELTFGSALMDSIATNRLIPSGTDSVTNIIPMGDIDSDGQIDFFVGEGYYHQGNAVPGNAVFVNGYPSASANLSNIGYAQLTGVGSDEFGHAAAFGDFFGDGSQSFVIGAPGASNGMGHLLTYDYSPGSLSGTTTGVSQATSVLNGLETLGARGLGWVVKNVGDFDGDGAEDVLVTEVAEAGESGHAYVFSGPCLGGESLTEEAALLHIEGLDTDSYFGYSADVGDINGDGTSDLIIGAYNTFLSSTTYPEGRIFVHLSGN